MTDTTYEEPSYGNWRKPRSAGIGKFSAFESALAVIGLLVVIVLFRLAGPLVGAAALIVLAGLFFTMTLTDKHGKSRISKMNAKRSFRNAARKRLNILRSGPAGLTPSGSYQLPGLLARSELYEFEDSFERPFAMLHMPTKDHASIVISVEPTGLALDDRENIDQYVANWGGWLSGLSKAGDVVAASVTVETAPDYGVRLAHEIDLNMHPDASPAAREMMEETKATFPQRTASTRAWVSITFRTWRPGVARVRNPQDVGTDLAARMGKFTEHLEVCGAGDARPVGAQELCEIVRTAYDPAVGEHIASAHIQGVTPKLSWDEIGPTAHNAGWEWYRHDSGLSKSWTMSAAPRGTVYSNVLENLLAPSPEVDRKRVTMVYRPVSTARAMDVAEKDVNKASSRATSTKKPSFQAAAEFASAVQSAKEVAKDAGLVNFGLIVTATILNEDNALAASYEIEDLAGGAQILLRPAYGAQDSTFAAGLPLGVVLPDYIAIPQAIREAL